jgi:hypothetical protein
MKKYEIIDIDYGYVHVRFSDNRTFKIPDQAHIETWKPLTECWSKDRKGLYQFNSKVHRKYYKHIDFDSFEAIEKLDDELTIYFKDKNNVYIDSYMCGFSIIEEAIPTNFEIIDIKSGFSTDGKNDFYYEKKLPYQLKDRKPINTHYSQINNEIYFGMTAKMESDISTFEIVNPLIPNVARDKNHIYYKNEIIEGADPSTFSFLEDCLSDKTPYYLDCDIDFYAKDSKQAYFISTPFMAKVIKTKSLNNFRFQVIEERGYAFDSEYRYERGKRKKLLPTKDIR